jgi:hypothetical protein
MEKDKETRMKNKKFYMVNLIIEVSVDNKQIK